MMPRGPESPLPVSRYPAPEDHPPRTPSELLRIERGASPPSKSPSPPSERRGKKRNEPSVPRSPRRSGIEPSEEFSNLLNGDVKIRGGDIVLPAPVSDRKEGAGGGGGGGDGDAGAGIGLDLEDEISIPLDPLQWWKPDPNGPPHTAADKFCPVCVLAPASDESDWHAVVEQMNELFKRDYGQRDTAVVLHSIDKIYCEKIKPHIKQDVKRGILCDQPEWTAVSKMTHYMEHSPSDVIRLRYATHLVERAMRAVADFGVLKKKKLTGKIEVDRAGFKALLDGAAALRSGLNAQNKGVR